MATPSRIAFFVLTTVVITQAAAPARADQQHIVIRSGQSGLDPSRDASVRVHSIASFFPPAAFSHVEFAAARAGFAAHITAPAPGWFAAPRQAAWITSAATGATSGNSAIYALPFVISPDDYTDRWTGSLSISFSVDDALGASPNGGMFLNEVPIAASDGGNSSTRTARIFEIPVGVLRTGENWLYFYVANFGAVVGGNPTGLTFSGVMTARPLSVGAAPSGGYPTIDAAVAAAAEGDVIPVLPGTYGPSRVDSKSVTLRAVGGPAVTHITSDDPLELPLLISGLPTSGPVEIEGFTISQGTQSSFAAVMVSRSTCTIRGCVLLPQASAYAVRADGSQGYDTVCRVENCLILQMPRDMLSIPSIGVYSFGLLGPTRCEVLLSGCTLVGVGSPVSIVHSESQGFPAAGVLRFDNCIVTGYGGIASNPSPFMVNRVGSTPNFAHTLMLARASNIRGGWLGTGNGNIDADPLFVDALAGDFRLSPGSPCIDAGLNTLIAGARDLGGKPRLASGYPTTEGGEPEARTDMGAHEFVRTTCGADFNNDGNINPDDLGDFINIYFQGCP